MPLKRPKSLPGASPVTSDTETTSSGLPKRLLTPFIHRHRRCAVVGFDGVRLRASVIAINGKENVAIESTASAPVRLHIERSLSEALRGLPEGSLPAIAILATTEAINALIELPLSASQPASRDEMLRILEPRLWVPSRSRSWASNEAVDYGWVPLQTPVSEG